MKHKKKLAISLTTIGVLSLTTLLATAWLPTDGLQYNAINHQSNTAPTTIARYNSSDVATPVAESVLNTYSYQPIDNNINSQPVTTEDGFLGSNATKNALFLTSYDGITIWSFDIANNPIIKQFYKQWKSVEDIQSYQIKSYVRIPNSFFLVVLFGMPDMTNNANMQTNSVVFAIDLRVGTLFLPNRNNNSQIVLNQAIIGFDNNPMILFLNSSNEIIVTVYKDYETYKQHTFKLRLDSSRGFTLFQNAIRFPAVDGLRAKNENEKWNPTHGQIGEMIKDEVDQVNNQKKISFNGTDPHLKINSEFKNDDTGKRWNLTSIIPGTTPDRNLAIFSDPDNFLTWDNEQKNRFSVHQQQAVLVDDNLNPVFWEQKIVARNLLQPVLLGKMGTFNSLDNASKYGFQGKEQDSFIWNATGLTNAVYKLQYNDKTHQIDVLYFFNLQLADDNDVFAWSYDKATDRYFSTNTFSRKKARVGFLSLNSNDGYQPLIEFEPTMNNGRPMFNIMEDDLTFLAPVTAPNNTPIAQTPVVTYYLKDNSKLTGLYAGSNPTSSRGRSASSEAPTTLPIQMVNLPFNSFTDLNTQAAKAAWHKQQTASSVSNAQLKSLFQTLNNDATDHPYQVQIQNVQANDRDGTLVANYQINYRNWWDLGATQSNFMVQLSLDNFYATSRNNFLFVTEFKGTGFEDNDSKFRKIEMLKAKVPSQITQQDVLDAFIIAKVLDINQQQITIGINDVSLVADDQLGTLLITIDVTNKLPKGIQKQDSVFSQMYTGFFNTAGFSPNRTKTPAEIANDPLAVNLQQNLFPSQLTVSQLLSHFVVLGPSYLPDITLWELDSSSTFNNNDGTAHIVLRYNAPNANSIPAMNRTVRGDLQGFKRLVDVFSDVKVVGYQGFLTPVQLYNDYLNDVQNNASNLASNPLLNTVQIPFISNRDYVFNTPTNLATANQDGFLNLEISIADNTTTQLRIGNNFYQYGINSNDYLTLLGKNPFVVQIPVQTTTQSFTWLNKDLALPQTPDEMALATQNNFTIDLSQVPQYGMLHAGLTTEDVTEQIILDLFDYSGFNQPTILLSKDYYNGTVTATIALSVQDFSSQPTATGAANFSLTQTVHRHQTSLNPNGAVVLKTLFITGLTPGVRPIFIALPVTIIMTILLIVLAWWIYLKVIQKNLQLKLNNQENPAYLAKINAQNQSKRDKKSLRKYEKMVRQQQKDQ